MASILVVDASASVRETIRIVLAGEHDVVAARDLEDLPADASPALVVLGLAPLPRDDRRLGETLARVVPDVPLLVLAGAGDVDVAALVPPHVPVDLLPKPFDAYTIRARARSLLRTRPAAIAGAERRETHRRHLEYPVLPRAAAALVRNVLTTDVPVVWLHGEIGTAAARVARALHVAVGRHGPFLTFDAAVLAAGELERRLVDAGGPDGSTVYVANLERAGAAVVADVGALAEHAVAHVGGAHVIVGSAADLGELVAAMTFPAELAYLLTTVPIVLTPLRERPEDIPALVELLTRDCCARFRLEPVRYAPQALERLQQYLWFGNLIELEAVLARTLLVHRPTVVEVEQLVFLPDQTAVPLTATGSVVPSAARASAPVAPVSATVGLPHLDLEVVLGELAHELRNPMVTIKTFAQHLDSVLADPEVRARFSALTTEAIGRMDALLETLLDFARFRAPARHPVDVRRLLDRALAEQAEELTRRHVTVERNGIGAVPVAADEAQVLFAFRSLCRGLVPDLSSHTRLVVRGAEHGVEVRVRTEASTAARLSAWVEPAAGEHGGESPPLMWALAGTLLARNGGTLSVREGDADDTVIRVEWLPESA